MDIINTAWFWSNKFQQFFLNTLTDKNSEYFCQKIPFRCYCRKKRTFEKNMSDLKTWDFVALFLVVQTILFEGIS